VLGVGSFTYQYVTRDTWGWAVKATYGVVNGEERHIFKCPKTDSGSKKSANGLVCVHQGDDGTLQLRQGASWGEFISPDNALKPVFRDGELQLTTTLSEIRKRVRAA
jgi:nicotinamide phosphoribosyltransferase